MEKADDLSPKHCTMLVSALSAVGLGKHTVAALETMKKKGLQLNKVRLHCLPPPGFLGSCFVAGFGSRCRLAVSCVR